MIRSKTQKNYNQISGINITPFTDIVLVLLIIFMVTANTLANDKSLKLNLPKAESADATLPKSVTVQISQGQRFYVNNVQVQPGELMAALQEHRQKNKTELLVVKADEKVPYESVIYAIDQARKVGITELGLATRQLEPAAPSR